MRQIVLTVLVCVTMTLVITGCNKEKERDNLQGTYRKIEGYFESKEIDSSNLGSYFLDSKNNIVVVTLINNSEEKQTVFLKKAAVSSKYVKFKQSGLNLNTKEYDFYISKPEVYNDIKFNYYYKADDRDIYLAGNIDEFYIDFKNNMSLKDYLLASNQTLDEVINSITEKLDRVETLKDGGTAIYKLKAKDITMVVCNTIDKNRNIYIGDYLMAFDESMCK